MFGKWLSLSILVLLFGSAFSFIELSLERYSPSFIAFFRVFVAFIILSIICIKEMLNLILFQITLFYFLFSD